MNAVREALLRGKRRPRRSGAGSPTLFRADGYEFVELREYIPGDDIRRIDWAATARTAQLQTRVVLEDVALTLAAIVDDSPSMQVGRMRPLAQSAKEAVDAWYAAAQSGDRVMHVEIDVPFELTKALDAAGAALPRGCALLVASDFWDLPDDDDVLGFLGSRFDCTALLARDPWHDGLPLSGLLRMRDAETGSAARVYFGKRERAGYFRAVREREQHLLERFARTNWRADVLDESDGAASLLRAFGAA